MKLYFEQQLILEQKSKLKNIRNYKKETIETW